jgi:hypothetical protein
MPNSHVRLYLARLGKFQDMSERHWTIQFCQVVSSPIISTLLYVYYRERRKERAHTKAQILVQIRKMLE